MSRRNPIVRQSVTCADATARTLVVVLTRLGAQDIAQSTDPDVERVTVCYRCRKTRLVYYWGAIDAVIHARLADEQP